MNRFITHFVRRLINSCCQRPARRPAQRLHLVQTAAALEARTLMSATIGTSPKAPSTNVAATAKQAGIFAPLGDTFRLNSRPIASKTIYLDFDGHTTSNTQWNLYTNKSALTQTAYSFEGGADFSNNELTRIQNIWQRVVEDFAPFDVNVTTQLPSIDDLRNSGGSDSRWGVRVVVGSTLSDFANTGGVAFIGSFTANSDTPAFVFEDNLGNGDDKFVAEAVSHEVGHTLGLSHDGRISPSEEYYRGHNGWAPIMGVGYDQKLTQWSRGEYLNASNTEGDLAIITTRNGFGYRPDDFANSASAAPVIAGANFQGVRQVDQSGVISTSSDSDWFKIVTSSSGHISLTIRGGAVDSNLNIKADLYDANGRLVVSSSPLGDLTARIQKTVSAGTYFLKIDGVGEGDPKAAGYSDYGSLGQFRITGTFKNGTTTPPGADSFGVWRNGTVILDSGARGYEGFEANKTYQFGLPGDIPVVGDWNSDGIDDLGVFRNGTFIIDSGARGFEGFEHFTTFQFGHAGDVPVIGDWDGNGSDDFGVWRNGTFYLDTGPRGFDGVEHLAPYQFGLPGDTPVVGDWDGDGKDDLGVWRSGNFILDTGRRGYEGFEHLTQFGFGLPGDTPIIGDWNSDGRDDFGVWRRGDVILDTGLRGFEGFEHLTTYNFGLAGDRPIIGRWGLASTPPAQINLISPSPLKNASTLFGSVSSPII